MVTRTQLAVLARTMEREGAKLLRLASDLLLNLDAAGPATDPAQQAPLAFDDETRSRIDALIARREAWVDDEAHGEGILTAKQVASASQRGAVVYFIQGGFGGPIKIGTTQSLRARLKGLQCGSPVRLYVLATLPGGDAQESELHVRFDEDRLHGEWFSPSASLLAFIETLKGEGP